MVTLVVELPQQRVLQRDFPARLLEPRLTGGQELGDRCVLGPRDELPAELVARRVERQRECDREIEFLTELANGLG